MKGHRPFLSRLTAAAGLWCLQWLVGTAQAHMLPAQNATMNIVDKAVFFVVSVPVSALQGTDLDGNGQLSLAEIDRGRAQISAQFDARFRVASDGEQGKPVLTWIVPPDDAATESAYVVILHRVDFVQAPAHPVLSMDLFGTGPGEATMTLTATRGKHAEVAILSPGTSTHEFFRGSFATFIEFVRIGLQHILGGPDHLLFLLTVVVAAAGWRRWLAFITAFTIAHSITLALSVLGIVRIPAAIVEPGIAASIVVMAVLNLRGGAPRTDKSRRTHIVLVFACGLLHGFGFAAAIGLTALDAGNRLATLAGFNLGIEIGQAVFLGAFLICMRALQRLGQVRAVAVLPRLASALAAVAGAAMLLERLYSLLAAAAR